MNWPDYLRTVWMDPRYQALEIPVKLLLYAGLSQVDIAGWWAPNPRLIAVEFPGLDLKDAAAALQPWVQVHPTGWWSFKGYVALQVGEKGLTLNNGFHNGIYRHLKIHRAREVEAGALPESVEIKLSSSTCALPPSSHAEDGGAPVGQGRGRAGAVSLKVQEPKDPSHESESPTRGSGGAGPQPEPSKLEDVLNLFRQYAPLAVLDVPSWDRKAIEAAEGRWGPGRVYAAAGAYFTYAQGPLPSIKEFLSKLHGLLQRTCSHESKRWWEFPVDREFPNGVKRKRWECEACGQVGEKADSDHLPSDHVHDYQPGTGIGLVLNNAGELVKVTTWKQCTGCGHRISTEEAA